MSLIDREEASEAEALKALGFAGPTETVRYRAEDEKDISAVVVFLNKEGYGAVVSVHGIATRGLPPVAKGLPSWGAALKAALEHLEETTKLKLRFVTKVQHTGWRRED